MLALAEPGLRWREHLVSGGAQPVRNPAPAPAAVPGAVNQHERLRLCYSSARVCRQTCNSHGFQVSRRCMIVAPFVTLDFCSGSLRSAGTHQCIRISIKGVRIMGQGFDGIFEAMALGPRRPPIGGLLLQRNFISILSDTASIWRKLAWQSGWVKVQPQEAIRRSAALAVIAPRCVLPSLDSMIWPGCSVGSPRRRKVRVLMAAVAEHVMDGSEEIQCARRSPASLRRYGLCACD